MSARRAASTRPQEPVRRAWRALRRHLADAERHVAAARGAAPGSGATDVADRAIHEARKSLKRARAFARLLAPALGADVVRELDRGARDVGRSLAPLRDAVAVRAALEVVRARLDGGSGPDGAPGREAVAPLEVGAPSDSTVWVVLARALGGEAAAPARPSAALDEAAGDLAALRARLRSLARPGPSPEAWARGLRALHRAARRAARAALAAPDDDDLVHAARARWKRLGLAVKAYRGAAPALVGPWVAEVEAVCELLGDDHDQVVLRARLADGVAGVPDEALVRVRAASEAIGAERRGDALARLARLAAEPAKGFAARHRTYVTLG